MIVNKYNFLRWNDPNLDPGLGPLPHGYWIDRYKCETAIVAVPGETMAFYMNANTGLALGAFDFKLVLIHGLTGAVVNADVAPLTQHVISGANYNFYASFLFPAVAPGLYFFEIRRGAAILLTSNKFESRSDYGLRSTFCKFRHDRWFYGIPYAQIPLFYQQFRLNINEIDDNPENDREIYKEITTGYRRTYKTDLDWLHKMETYYFGYDDHQAATVMTEHDDFQMNGKPYTLKATYRKNGDPRQKMGKGEFEVYDEEFAAFNRCIT